MSETQEQRLHEWLATLPPVPETAVGGRLTISFTVTSIADIVVARDITGSEIDLTEW